MWFPKQGEFSKSIQKDLRNKPFGISGKGELEIKWRMRSKVNATPKPPNGGLRVQLISGFDFILETMS